MSTENLLQERGSTHGAFSENARLSQGFEDLARTGKNWDKLTAIQKEGLKLDFHKSARFLSGNPNFIDCIRDRIGYLQLILNELEQMPDVLDVKQEYIVLNPTHSANTD